MITVDDYLSGESTWQCIGSFTGEITNPAHLSAQANVTDSELGFFTTTNIVIGATGATVAVGAGVVIAGAGAGTLTAAGAATASSVLQTAQSLASKYAYTGATAESIQQNIVNALDKKGRTFDTASVSDLVQAETTALAEITNIPPAELIDQVVAADPSIAKKMGEEFTKLQETALSGSGMPAEIAKNKLANKDAWARDILGSATNKKTLTKIYSDGGILTLRPAFTAGGLSSMRLPRLRVPMQARSRAGGGPRYHRIPIIKLHL